MVQIGVELWAFNLLYIGAVLRGEHTLPRQRSAPNEFFFKIYWLYICFMPKTAYFTIWLRKFYKWPAPCGDLCPPQREGARTAPGCTTCIVQQIHNGPTITSSIIPWPTFSVLVKGPRKAACHRRPIISELWPTVWLNQKKSVAVTENSRF